MSGVVDEVFGCGSYGARHSMPLQRHMTTPRQYIGPDGRVRLPGNSARNAISDELARAAMLPGESRSEKPVFAEWKGRSSNLNPVLIRGNKRKKRMTSGAA
jgi:hypothetical protein